MSLVTGGHQRIMADKFDFKFQFTDKKAEIVIKNLPKQVNRIVKETLNAIGANVAERSKKLAPIDKGDLRASIKAEPAKITGQGVILSVSSDKPYALKMHEAFYTAQRSPTGGKQPIEPDQPEGPIGRRYIARVIEHEPNRKRYEQALARAIENNIGKIGKVRVIDLPAS